jgi:hypothetical protein
MAQLPRPGARRDTRRRDDDDLDALANRLHRAVCERSRNRQAVRKESTT